MFVPHCCNAINQIASSKSPQTDIQISLINGFWPLSLCFPTRDSFCLDEEVLNEEELDKELLWNLQLLSEVIKTYF